MKLRVVLIQPRKWNVERLETSIKQGKRQDIWVVANPVPFDEINLAHFFAREYASDKACYPKVVEEMEFNAKGEEVKK